jgi:hypothetical protein
MSQYWINIGQKVHGPFTAKQLKYLAKKGELKPRHLVSTDQQRWRRADAIRGLDWGAESAPDPNVSALLDDELGAGGIPPDPSSVAGEKGLGQPDTTVTEPIDRDSYAAKLIRKAEAKSQADAATADPRPDRLMLEQWQPLLDGLHSVFVGLLAWLASLGTVVASILMLVLLAVGFAVLREFATSIQPPSFMGGESGSSIAAHGALMGLLAVFVTILQFVFSEHEELFWPAVGMLATATILAGVIAAGYFLPVLGIVTVAFAMSQCVILWAWTRMLFVPSAVFRALVFMSVLLLVLSLTALVLALVDVGTTTGLTAKDLAGNNRDTGWVTRFGISVACSTAAYVFFGMALAYAVLRLYHDAPVAFRINMMGTPFAIALCQTITILGVFPPAAPIAYLISGIILTLLVNRIRFAIY